jgi:hypothetical protein
MTYSAYGLGSGVIGQVSAIRRTLCSSRQGWYTHMRDWPRVGR